MGYLMPFTSVREKKSASGGSIVPGEFVLTSYTGTYETDEHGYIRFLSSGTLIVENDTLIDAFLVGGGGSGASAEDSVTYNGQPGGGGGNTETRRGVALYGGRGYPIKVGEGGEYSDGGTTTAFGARAAGGLMYRQAQAIQQTVYPDGGSGGGGYNGAGGADGLSGTGVNAGAGQGRTTRLFGEAGSELFAGGGAGGASGASLGEPFPVGGEGGGGDADPTGAMDGAPNTGGGGAGGSWYYKETDMGDGTIMAELMTSNPGKGGSGIVIIREAV